MSYRGSPSHHPCHHHHDPHRYHHQLLLRNTNKAVALTELVVDPPIRTFNRLPSSPLGLGGHTGPHPSPLPLQLDLTVIWQPSGTSSQFLVSTHPSRGQCCHACPMLGSAGDQPATKNAKSDAHNATNSRLRAKCQPRVPAITIASTTNQAAEDSKHDFLSRLLRL